MFLGDMAFWT